MGTEITDHTAAAVAYLRPLVGDRWPVYPRADGSLRPATETWGVEIAVVLASISEHYDMGLAGCPVYPRAELACQASIRYVGRSISHARYAEAMDIAVTLGALLSHARFRAASEAVRDVTVVTEPESAIIGGLLNPTGAYRVMVQWVDTTPVTPWLELDGQVIGHREAGPQLVEEAIVQQTVAGGGAPVETHIVPAYPIVPSGERAND